MAATKENQFWKLRSKHGRNKLFDQPDVLWTAACEYFDWCDNNPWLKKEALKSGDLAGSIMDVPTQRPYTFSGLCFYLGVNKDFFNQSKRQEHYKDFTSVFNDIQQVIETQQFEGATVGTFNANIIGRILGLVDKADVTSDGSPILQNTNHVVIFKDFSEDA